MNKRVSLGAALAMALVAAAAAVAITASLCVKMYNSIISDLPDRQQMYSSVAEIDNLIRGQYYGNIDSDRLDDALFRGYVLGLDDEYSQYMTADEYHRYQTRAKGQITGIGIVTVWDAVEEALKVSSVADGSPAQAAGLKKGDVIKKVDEVAVTKDNYAKLTDNFEGEMLTKVNVTYRRGGKTSIVSVVRGYESQAVTYDFQGTTGVITVLDFYDNAKTQMRSALDSLLSSGAASLIIDLRNTTAGDISVAAAMADYFVPLATQNQSMMAKAVNKSGVTVKTYSSDTDEINLPVVLLLNGKTEGAAEFFACTLMSFGKAQAVGSATYGKCALQEIFELSNGGAVLLNVANIIPYSGESYEGKGVVPDYLLKMTDEQAQTIVFGSSKDFQMQKALELLTGESEESADS